MFFHTLSEFVDFERRRLPAAQSGAGVALVWPWDAGSADQVHVENERRKQKRDGEAHSNEASNRFRAEGSFMPVCSGEHPER